MKREENMRGIKREGIITPDRHALRLARSAGGGRSLSEPLCLARTAPGQYRRENNSAAFDIQNMQIIADMSYTAKIWWRRQRHGVATRSVSQPTDSRHDWAYRRVPPRTAPRAPTQPFTPPCKESAVTPRHAFCFLHVPIGTIISMECAERHDVTRGGASRPYRALPRKGLWNVMMPTSTLLSNNVVRVLGDLAVPRRAAPHCLLTAWQLHVHASLRG